MKSTITYDTNPFFTGQNVKGQYDHICVAQLKCKRVVLLSKPSDWKQMKYVNEWFYTVSDDIETCSDDAGNELFDNDYVLIASIVNEKSKESTW